MKSVKNLHQPVANEDEKEYADSKNQTSYLLLFLYAFYRNCPPIGKIEVIHSNAKQL